jgi:chromosome segregation ATPase
MDGRTADAPTLRLHRVQLTNFKAYSGRVTAGPLDPRWTTIVGANGAGKSCLIEGVCFALGAAQQNAPALAQLVHRGAAGGTSAAAVFRSTDGAVSLVVERRIVGGRRSEWRLQECSCGATAAEGVAPPWTCSTCAKQPLARDALRGAL